MAERLKAPVLKTGDPQGSVGSNPTPSARLIFNDLRREVHLYRNASRNASALFHYRFYWDYSAKLGEQPRRSSWFEFRRPDHLSVNAFNVSRLYKRRCARLGTVLVTILLRGW